MDESSYMNLIEDYNHRRNPNKIILKNPVSGQIPGEILKGIMKEITERIPIRILEGISEEFEEFEKSMAEYEHERA